MSSFFNLLFNWFFGMQGDVGVLYGDGMKGMVDGRVKIIESANEMMIMMSLRYEDKDDRTGMVQRSVV